MKKYISYFLLTIVSLYNCNIFSQSDTTKYKWPYEPMNLQRNVGGAFGEYRSTSPEGHYHNGVDISGAAGTAILAVLPGTVSAAFDDPSEISNSFVRVTSVLNNKIKNITYFHTRPVVSVGQTVSEGQQISTVAVDHVHLIDYRLTNSSSEFDAINALRPDGGISIYQDNWKPHIRFVRFLLDNSTQELSPASLGDKVDIIAHVEEVNGTSAASQNNGTYKIGYKILSADKKSVVFNPPDNGLRFKYYNKPDNSYVNINYYQPESNTSRHVYLVTNGQGASAVESTQAVTNNYWNTSLLPFGNYTVLVFTEDVRGNVDSVFVPVTTIDIDLIPPAAPTLKSVIKDSTDYFTISWVNPPDTDLKGFRLYFSLTGNGYQLRDNETVLNNNLNEKTYFYNLMSPLYLKLNAVDSAGNESIESDTYGIKISNDNKKVLIVDGFDRVGGGGSWQKPYHDFLIKYGEVLKTGFESCSNEQIIQNSIDLKNYQMVIWILGDESTADETFNFFEREKVADYLEAGGNLFISGSEIAWDLSGASSATAEEKLFLNNFLKAKYIADDSNINVIISTGVQPFTNLNFSYGITSQGSPYFEDFPDVIDTVNGSIPIFSYDGGGTAGIAFSGKFNNSNNIAKLIYLAFPFETIPSKEIRAQIMDDVLSYFDILNPTSVKEKNIKLDNFFIWQNFPNPFNPTTKIRYNIPSIVNKLVSKVKLSVYDILGREVAVLVNEEQPAGNYEVTFDASNLSSGVYIYKIIAGNFTKSMKMLLLK